MDLSKLTDAQLMELEARASEHVKWGLLRAERPDDADPWQLRRRVFRRIANENNRRIIARKDGV